MTVFNEIHNQSFPNIGRHCFCPYRRIIKEFIKTLKDHGTDITYENEFKIIKNDKC